MPTRPFALCLALLALSVPPLQAQAAAPTDYHERSSALWKLTRGNRAAPVRDLVLRRDAATITLETGTLYLLEPVADRVVAAVFRGAGRLQYAPATTMEQGRLRLFRKSTRYDEPFDEMILFFADSTLEEVERQVTFTAGEAPGELARRFRELLDYFGDEGDDYLDPDLLRPLLNGERTGLFLAMVSNGANDPWMFLVNPHEYEGIQLLTRAKRTARARRVEAVTMERPLGESAPLTGERRPEARIRHYALDISLPETGAGDLRFKAVGRLDLTADTTIGPWLPFYLYEEMEVDSARWADGQPATVVKPRHSPYLWVRVPEPLRPGEVRTLVLGYQGDLLERFGSWFFLKDPAGWYPSGLEGRTPATYDLTFTSPAGFPVASVGRRTETSTPGPHLIRSHWVTTRPIWIASFNVGLYDEHEVREGDAPPVTVLWSDEMHRAFSQGGQVLSGRNMKQQVGSDVANAVQFFRKLYGDLPMERFYVTETPAFHGIAFAGMVHLSFVTFQQTREDGFDQFFRAHEVAHQWWPHAVEYATYHDRWMSEGFASFSGLWYLQTRRQSNDKYFDMLRKWKAGIMLRRDDPIPVWLGHRVATANTPEDYSAIVYDKGAYVLHMLRILLLDLNTMSEDRFTGVMQEFYRSFAGRRASTLDFQRTVERRLGQDMAWFFNQWVYGVGIPTYRVAWRAEPAGDKWQVRLRVEQERVPPEFVAYVPVTVELGGNQVARFRVKVTGARSELILPPVGAKPQQVRFNDFEGVLAEVKSEGW